MNKEILKKAIEKALANGWMFDLKWENASISNIQYPNYYMGEIILDYEGDEGVALALHKSVYEVIFSHDFAKAFWGEDQTMVIIDNEGDWYPTNDLGPCKFYEIRLIEWQYHLQQMVIEENPINYLKKFI